MKHKNNFRKVLISLMLIFSLLFLTACDKTKDGGETIEGNKTSENNKNKSISYIDNKEEIDAADFSELSTEQVFGLMDHPMVIKADGALKLDLGYRADISQDFIVDYIDYNSFFENPSADLSDERYADVTKDGKVNWSIPEIQEFPENSRLAEMLENITIDGKKVSLPMKFSDLGEEYAIFDQVDFSAATEKMHPFQIIDIKTKNKLLSGYKEINNRIKGYLLLNNKDELIISVLINMDSQYIVGLSTVRSNLFILKNVKIDNIGSGNTLNEMYEKLGCPTKIDNHNSLIPTVGYYSDNMGIQFYLEPEMYHSINKVEYSKVIKNVITGITLYSK